MFSRQAKKKLERATAGERMLPNDQNNDKIMNGM